MAAQFSVHGWLRAAGWSNYETNLLEHGYNTYKSCVNISKVDLLACIICEMAAQFSVHDWLRAAGWSNYETNLSEHGYNTYKSCVNISKVDLLASSVKWQLSSVFMVG